MNTILVYVQHLLGVGHLHRTALITRALAQDDFDVTVVSGGMPEASIDFGKVKFLQLEPIKTDAEFKALYDKNGKIIDDCFKRSRAEMLIDIVGQVNPDMVIIETYPFGRRQMRFELLPLLEYLKNGVDSPPLIASSIRDVIQPKQNPKRSQEIIDIIDQYFDMVFVHGDDSFISFELTFPDAIKFKEKLVYSGYVVKPLPHDLSCQRDNETVLVSAGGGAVGKQIYNTVHEASKDARGKQYVWHMLVGGNYSSDEFNKLLNLQHRRLKIERNRPDFLQLLSRCAISVSQAGYNTMMDLLVTGTPALVVPFEGVAEREQLIRARKFEELGLTKVIREKHLNSANLLEAMMNTTRPIDSQLQINLHGAKRMVEILKQKIAN